MTELDGIFEFKEEKRTPPKTFLDGFCFTSPTGNLEQLLIGTTGNKKNL